MNARPSITPPRSFWILGVLFLLWNLIGLAAFFGQTNLGDEALAALPEGQRALLEATPGWATAAFALAVFGGTLGCVALLLRKAWAVVLFMASLAGVLVQNAHGFLLSDTLAVLGPTSLILPILVLLAAIFLVIYSRKARDAGWIY